MLRAFPGPQEFPPQAAPGAPPALRAALWLDLLGPDPAAQALAEEASGLCLPGHEAISEIESSSRLAEAHGVLTLSTPMLGSEQDGMLASSPLGLVLSETRLVTLRFAANPAFEAAGRRLAGGESRAAEAFLALLEELVDQLADRLEQCSAALDRVNARLFGRGLKPQQSAWRRDAMLRVTLAEVGRDGDTVALLRDALLGHARILRYARDVALFLTDAERRRIKTLLQDIASLNDYAAQLSGKVQFVLDATLGFINIEQNNSIKFLTVVSLVGIPPTLIASIYGMNFEHMPELHWAWGYPYALGMILASALVPLAWFRLRGWI